jgi:hypothetical protein
MTTIVTGLASSLAVMAWSGASAVVVREVCGALALATIAKLGFEVAVLIQLRDIRRTPLRKTALLLVGPLRRASLFRLGLGVVGGLALPLIVALLAGSSESGLRVVSGLAFGLVILGELVERYLFFASVVRPKMPGGVPS